MNCKKAQDNLSPYLDQVLSQEDVNALEKHLEKCSKCRKELEDLQKTLIIIQTLPELPLPIGFHQELRKKLVAVKEEGEGQKGNGWINSLYNFRYRWASLGMAAVLMVFLYAFLPPLLHNSMEQQSDITYSGIVQNEKDAKSRLPEMASDTEFDSFQGTEESTSIDELINTENSKNSNTENNTQENEKIDMVMKEEKNQEASEELNEEITGEVYKEVDKEVNEEQIRQDTFEASRGNNNPEEAKIPIFSMTVVPPEQNVDRSERSKIVEYTDLKLMIKKDEYENTFDRISNLSKDYKDVLDVGYEKIQGEDQESFIITVIKGTIPKVLSEINTWDKTVNQDVYSAGVSPEQIEYIYIKIVIKEK